MRAFFKWIAFVLVTAVLLSLCLTPMVFATEEPPHGGDILPGFVKGTELAEATPSDAEEELQEEELLEDDITELSVATPSVATPSVSTPAAPISSVAAPAAAGKNPLAEADTVSTGEELYQWLSDHGAEGGVVRLSDDIYLRDFIYVHGLRMPAVTIDTGEFSIIVDDYAELHAGSPLTIRGAGGEKGLLRVTGDGFLYINGITLEAEHGYAAFQEEGAGLLVDQTTASGEVHYAKLPYVSEWVDELVVEEREQIFEEGHLPATLTGRVIRQGQIIDFHEEIPVIWDLTGYEEAQKNRQRFTVTGEFENMASQNAPVCTVVYDDSLLTFLEIKATRITGGRGDAYKFTGSFSQPEDRLPITIAQEYSFDGENWTLYENAGIAHPSDAFTIHIPAEPGEIFPVIFIRLSWDDSGTMYYSNVLRFAGDSLEVSGEHGGNRGGGTDIIDPPGTPEPDPETVPPPETSGPEITVPPNSSEPETTVPPEASEPEITRPPLDHPDHNDDGYGSDESGDGTGPDQAPSKPEPPADTGREDSLSSLKKNQEIRGDESGVRPEAMPAAVPETEPGQAATPEAEAEQAAAPGTEQEQAAPPGNQPGHEESPETESSRTAAPEAEAEQVAAPGSQPEVRSEQKPAPQSPDIPSAMAGFAAIAVSMGGAALYLHPKVRKRLLGKIWSRFKR